MTTKRFIIPLFATLLTLAFSTISAKPIAIIGNVSDTLKAELATSEIDTVAGEGTVYFLVEEMPQFNYKGANELDAFRNYVQQNLKYPEIVQDYPIQGMVYVSFIVEKDGRVSTIRIVRSLGKPFDDEVVRVVAHAPKWIPGRQNGNLVRVTFTFPVSFQQ